MNPTQTPSPVSPTLLALMSNEPLSREEEARLARRIKRGDSTAAWTLVLANARFAFKLTSAQDRPGVSVDDLMAIALVEMHSKAEHFDPAIGKFITYVAPTIRKVVSQYAADNLNGYRVPYRMNILRNQLAADIVRGDSELTGESVAEKCGVSMRSAYALIAMLDERISLDAPASAEPGAGSLGELIADDSFVDSRDSLEEEEQLAEALSLLHQLDERQRMVIVRRFGLENHEPETLGEIAASLGVTRERIRQIEFKALRTLREMAVRKRNADAREEADARASLLAA